MTTRPQLSIEDLHQLKWVLGGILALFSVWTVFYLELDIWTLLIVDTLAITACIVWPKLPSFVPGWIHKAAFPIIVFVFLADLWLTAEILPAMVRLALMIILYRGVSYRLRRDDLQLIVLGLFLVVLTGVVTVSVAFVLQIAFFTACTLGFLFVLTLIDAIEAKDPAPRTPLFTWRLTAGTPSWIHQIGWIRLFGRVRAATNWKVLALGMGLFAGVVAVSAVIFMSIPRFQLENTLFLDRFMTKKARVGFTDNIRFGDVTDIQGDTSLALTVVPSDPVNLPATPYFRMVVLDEYRESGFRLSAPSLSEGFKEEASMTQVQGRLRPRLGTATWTFFLEAGVSRYLPMPSAFEQLRFTDRQRARVSPRFSLVRLANEPVAMLAYQIIQPDLSPLIPDPDFVGILDSNPGGRAMRPELRLPALESDKAELRAMVAEITGGENLTPEDFARRASAWLSDRHGYSLQSALPAGSGDPLVRWLRSKQPGHCEFFAGGFSLLARTAGIPTRIVSGFMGGSWNPFSKALTIRNNNAHAWCEIWDGKGSWLRVDPTPGSVAVTTSNDSVGANGLASRADRSWTARIDSIRVFWYLRVVNFDQNDQLATVQSFRAMQDRVKKSMDAMAIRLQNFLRSAWDPRRIGILVGIITALAGLGWVVQTYLRDWRWRFGAVLPGRSNVEPIRQEAGRWLRKFGPASVRAPAGLRRGEPPLPADAASVHSDLTRLRYAARETWPPPARVFEGARQAYRTARSRKRAGRAVGP